MKKPTIKLTGHDGNAFAILGTARRELKNSGATPEEIDVFHKEATSSDYYHLLLTVFNYFNVK